jgi:eukaryotic-like serine/threonine-protein kinase
MGEVYRARDTRLGREIALKVLPPEVAAEPDRMRRFEQEARAASALNHPNVVTVHDVGSEAGRFYIAMELVEGSSLRERIAGGPLSALEVAAIGAQIAEGLAKAHAASLVHRDLKPENVMISSDGFVKILDFGLAKLAPPEAVGSLSLAETAEQRTAAGVLLGTLGYMSPEQASGRPLDHRSDQFALGAILYELASERKAFQRTSAAETLAAILREEPPPLSSIASGVPDALSGIVARCLAKNPQERYDSTRDLARDLRGLGESGVSGLAAGSGRPSRSVRRIAVILVVAVVALAAVWWARRPRRPSPASGSPSIAILPFQDFGGRPEDEYFADGMTESLITDLARVPGLLVIARNSTFSYKGKPVDVKRVGEELRVRYVLEGSVQRSGDAVRVNAQLIDAGTGYHVWAEKYDRPMRDVFALEDDISRSVAGALRATLGGPRAGAPRPAPTSNLEAYDAFLRGRYYLNQYDWVSKDKSIPLFARALELDPGFALAHAMLGVACAKKAFEGDPEGTWRAKASAEIEKALSLDPALPEAYLAQGNLAWTRENGFPHEQAVADFHRALSLNGNLAEAHAALAGVYYHVGLLDEALEQYRVALKIDPRNSDAPYRMPRIRLYQQKYAEALSGFDASPLFANDFLKPIVLDHLGRGAEARRLAETNSLTNPTHSKADETADAASTLAVLLARAAEARRAEEEIATAIRKGERSSHFHHAAYNIATAYALLGRKSEAVAWLERTADWGMPCYPLFERDPYLDSLRAESAFGEFLRKRKAQWERFRESLLAPAERGGGGL